MDNKTKGLSCAFTGHRPQNLPFGFDESDVRCVELKIRLYRTIESLITTHHVTHFISGMALGVDMYAAEIVLELKEKFPEITLECAIPCETQASRWNTQMQKRYNNIVSKADKKTVLQSNYTADCMDKRNKYMVEHADFLIAVWNKKPSGTGNTVRYAKKLNKVIGIINPETIK